MTHKKCCSCLKTKLISEFNRKKSAKSGYCSSCRECSRAYNRNDYANNKQRYINKALEYKGDVKKWFKEYKSTLSCNRCPENHFACMQFHHLDPNAKEINISIAVASGWSIESIKKEIEKCEILCANCHAKEHYKLL